MMTPEADQKGCFLTDVDTMVSFRCGSYSNRKVVTGTF